MSTELSTILRVKSTDIPKTNLLDLGCGPNKIPGAFGVDIHPYPGVDLTLDLNHFPWPLETSRFHMIVARHVIEHVEQIVPFMKELHRVAAPGAKIYFETPHFSSLNSWSDPTHVRHLSSEWPNLFTTGYLAAQTGQFRLIESNVTFGKTWRGKLGGLIAGTRGLRKWEKSSAFVFPASDIVTLLEVVK